MARGWDSQSPDKVDIGQGNFSGLNRSQIDDFKERALQKMDSLKKIEGRRLLEF